jgi:hypothetical protein
VALCFLFHDDRGGDCGDHFDCDGGGKIWTMVPGRFPVQTVCNGGRDGDHLQRFSENVGINFDWENSEISTAEIPEK